MSFTFYASKLTKTRFWTSYIAAMFNLVIATLILIKYCRKRKELNKPTSVVVQLVFLISSGLL